MKYAVGDRIEDKVPRVLPDGSKVLEYGTGVIEAIEPAPDNGKNGKTMVGKMSYRVRWERGIFTGHIGHMLIEWVDDSKCITRGVQ